MRLGFITSNKGKLTELQNAMTTLGHEVVQLSISYPELQVDTIEEVATFGLDWIIKNEIETNEPGDQRASLSNIDMIMLEDSGLFIDALNNFPGVYSKYVFTTIGYSGVLDLMKNRAERDAHFESCIALINIHPNDNDATTGLSETNNIEDRINIFKGECTGTITKTARGSKGFGFDPIFKPHGAAKTFAEMDTNLKNSYSHRGKAVRKLVEFLSYL